MLAIKRGEEINQNLPTESKKTAAIRTYDNIQKKLQITFKDGPL